MKERRALSEGIESPAPPVDPAIARKFIHADKFDGEEAAPLVPPQPTTAIIERAPLSTRIRKDFTKALKKASLERQLNGVEPNTLQDILEEAVEPWLKSNGYIT